MALIDALGQPTTLVIRQLPLAAQRALAVTKDRQASRVLLVGLLEHDPTLTQALLRFANSALNATSAAPCVSISEAVRRVGSAGVESVILRFMIEGMLCRPGGRYQAMADLAWSHMVRTAPICRALAHLFSTHPDEAYTLGLLHDVGKLIVFDQIGALRSALHREPRFPERFVSTALSMLHEPLGGLAALEWGLGPVAAGAIASHSRSTVLSFADDESQLLHVAERADLARCRGEPTWVETCAVQGRIGVEPRAIEDVLAVALAEIDATEG